MADETNWGQIAAGLAGSLLGGPAGAAASSGLFSLIAPMFSDRDEQGINKNTPRYASPYDMQRRLLSQQLINSKTGTEFASAQAGMHENRAKELYEKLDRNFSGNPSVSADLYNQVHRQAEGENMATNLQGAQMNERTKEAGMGELNQLAGEDAANWHDYINRGAKPTLTESVLGDAFSRATGQISGGASRIGNDLIMQGLGLDYTGKKKTDAGGDGGTSGTGDDGSGDDWNWG